MANPLDIILNLRANTSGFDSGMNVARSAATALAGALAAIGLGLSAKEFIDIADATQQMASRLKNATDSTEEYNEVQARLLNLANSTYRPLAEAQEVYLSTAATMKSLGYSTEQILSVTESLSLSFTHNATRADQAQAAQDALSKAMAKGAVDADAWASIITGADNVVGDLARSTGRTESEVRSLGANGKVSINELTNALIQSRDRNQELADAMSTSTADGIQYLKNNVTALIGSLNEQYDITGKLSSVLVTMGDNLDWLSMLFEDAIAGVNEWADSLGAIDEETIIALKQALSAAYDIVKDLIANAAELGKTVFEVFTAAGNTISILTGDLDSAGESVSFLTRIVQGLSIAFGFVSDGIYASRISINVLAGAFYDFGASVAAVLSKITFGDISKRFAADAEYLKGLARENFADADQLAQDFDSKGIKRLQESAKTKQEIYADEAAKAKEAFEKIAQTAEASEDKKLKAAEGWAAAAVKANNEVLSAEIQRDLMNQGFMVTQDKSGKLAVIALNKVEDAAGNTGETIKRNAEEAAKVLKIDLYQAINGISEGFNNSSKSLDTFIKGMTQLGITGQRAGEVTYQAWLEWLKTAKNQQEVDVATFKLQEFGKTGQLSTQQVEMGMQAIRQVVQKLPADLDPVEQAFERLGIKTKEQLKLAAQSAMADFNTIASSGKGTAEDVEKAYQRVIQAAIASGDQSVISQAKAQAAMGGLTVEIDKTGKAVTQTFEEFAFGADKAVKATDRVSGGFDRAGNAGISAARATSEAWDNTVTSLSKAADKLDEITRKQGGMTGSDFLKGEKGKNADGTSYNLTSKNDLASQLKSGGYSDADAARIAQNIMLKAFDADKGFIDKNLTLPGGNVANELINKNMNAGLSANPVIQQLLNDALNRANGAKSSLSAPPAPYTDTGNRVANAASNLPDASSKTVKHEISFNGMTADVYTDANGSNQLDSILRELETISKSSFR